MSEYSDIVFEVEDPVAVIRLNRPEKLNSFTYHTLAEIRRAVAEAARLPEVVGIVITGTGRAFSAGLDSQALADTVSRGTPAATTEPAAERDLPGLFSYLLEVPKLVVGALNGVAAGGGMMLALKCDVRIASTAGSFTTTFMKRGLIAEHGSTWLLPRLVGTGAALDLLLTSRRVDAAESLRLGLVEYVCEPEELMERAKAYVAQVAANAAPQAIAESKAMVYRQWSAAYPEAFADTDRIQWKAIERADATEGARALLEKREPRFARLPADYRL